MTPSPNEIEAQRTARGGFTKATLAQWGIEWPPPKGWMERLHQTYYEEIQMPAPVSNEVFMLSHDEFLAVPDGQLAAYRQLWKDRVDMLEQLSQNCEELRALVKDIRRPAIEQEQAVAAEVLKGGVMDLIRKNRVR